MPIFERRVSDIATAMASKFRAGSGLENVMPPVLSDLKCQTSRSSDLFLHLYIHHAITFRSMILLHSLRCSGGNYSPNNFINKQFTGEYSINRLPVSISVHVK